jgi:hypothetical protein
MVDTPKVVALKPLKAHGDTEDRPKPVPSLKRINDSVLQFLNMYKKPAG